MRNLAFFLILLILFSCDDKEVNVVEVCYKCTYEIRGIYYIEYPTKVGLDVLEFRPPSDDSLWGIWHREYILFSSLNHTYEDAEQACLEKDTVGHVWILARGFMGDISCCEHVGWAEFRNFEFGEVADCEEIHTVRAGRDSAYGGRE